MNESKSDPNNNAQREKWRRSGAIGTVLDAETQPIKKVAKPITAIGVGLNSDGTKRSTLSIGDKIIFQGDGGTVSEPEVCVVVPGEPYKLGDRIRAKDLPKGTQTAGQAFGNKL